MSEIVSSYRLTHQGAMTALEAAMRHAENLAAPVTISICDASGVLLAACRMDKSYFLSIESSLNKAATAAATGRLTGEVDEMVSLKLGVATHGRQASGLKGGVPIIVEGQVIGGIGAGSATGEQDREIALAGAAALPDTQVQFGL